LQARRAALALIEAARARRAGIDDASASLKGLEPRDRAFAHALAAATLRRWGSIERVLQGRLQRPPPEPVLNLLRIGVAQLALLEMPAHAAVSTTLALAETDKTTRPFKGLINGVLRGLDRAGAGAALDEAPLESDLPDWLVARWRASWGAAAVDDLARRLRETPPTDLSVRDPATADALAAELEGVVLPGGSVRTVRRGDVAGWPGYEAGGWWVQDFAAAAPVRLLDPKPGERVLDLCAAPGGKTLQIAAAGAVVTAVDRAAVRVERISENLARTGLSAQVQVGDAQTWTGDGAQFDAVLLDAPCTATGTFRRHPDVLWAAKPTDVASLSAVQAKLLDAAAQRVAPGGRLVYCVCSLEREEGEAQASAFVSRNPGFHLANVDPATLGLPAAAAARAGGLRLLPSFSEPSGGMDGFFLVRFDRAA
jgi:16S rRNA (cytosine967-C5)-methyltransferase